LDFAGEVRHFVVDYGYLAVFLGILLEDFGLPTPGETMLIAGAVIASHGSLNILILLPVAWLAAVTGDSIGYFIGAFGGNKLLVRHGGRVGITDARLKKVEDFFSRYGDVVVLFARFVVVLRQLNGIVAGTLEMSWPRFFVYNATGAALWVGLWGGATYWLGRRLFEDLHELGAPGHLVIAIGAVIVTVAAVGFRLWWQRRSAAAKPGDRKP
jgi:membrane protein DedA with SNARE-associated domain